MQAAVERHYLVGRVCIEQGVGVDCLLLLRAPNLAITQLVLPNQPSLVVRRQPNAPSFGLSAHSQLIRHPPADRNYPPFDLTAVTKLADSFVPVAVVEVPLCVVLVLALLGVEPQLDEVLVER